MKELYQAVEAYLSGASPQGKGIYPAALAIGYRDNQVVSSPIEEYLRTRRAEAPRLVRLDLLDYDLAYAQVESQGPDGYRREILGLLRLAQGWNVLSVLHCASVLRFQNPYHDKSAEQSDSLHTLCELLLQYCHCVYAMQAEPCLALFWPQARMYHPNDETCFTDVPIQVLRERWHNAPDPVANGFSEFSRIYHIEMLDANTAIAKIGCRKLDISYTDYLSCIKTADGWRIVSKMTKPLHIGPPI